MRVAGRQSRAPSSETPLGFLCCAGHRNPGEPLGGNPGLSCYKPFGLFFGGFLGDIVYRILSPSRFGYPPGSQLARIMLASGIFVFGYFIAGSGDIERAETLALQGAKKILTVVRPTWLIEVHGSEGSALADIMLRSCYNLFSIDGTSVPKGSRLPHHVIARPM